MEINGDSTCLGDVCDRPCTLATNFDGGLFVPQINVIPNTPVDPRSLSPDIDDVKDNQSVGSGSTSGADEFSDKEDIVQNSSSDESDTEGKETKISNGNLKNYTCLNPTSPEQFAQEKNLVLETAFHTDDANMLSMAKERVVFQQRQKNTPLFSVNLGIHANPS